MDVAHMIELALAATLGGTAPGIFLLRQQRMVMAAQAGDTQASATDRIASAAARILEQTGDLLPSLTAQVATLNSQVATLQQQQERERAETLSLRRWIIEHTQWDRTALTEIERLGGHLDAPPAPPGIVMMEVTHASS